MARPKKQKTMGVGYDMILVEIIKQAMIDYVNAMKDYHYPKRVGNTSAKTMKENASYRLNEVERFFYGWWFQGIVEILTDSATAIKPDDVLAVCKKRFAEWERKNKQN